MRVNQRCPHISVPRQFLNGADIVIGLEQVCGKGVSERYALIPVS